MTRRDKDRVHKPKPTCMDCGKEISYKSKRCQSCSSKKQWADPEYVAKHRQGMKKAWADGRMRA